MSDLKRPDVDKFVMVEDYGGDSVFNSSEEEERYQAFKKRLIGEVVARERSPNTAQWIEQELHDTATDENYRWRYR